MCQKHSNLRGPCQAIDDINQTTLFVTSDVTSPYKTAIITPSYRIKQEGINTADLMREIFPIEDFFLRSLRQYAFTLVRPLIQKTFNITDML